MNENDNSNKLEQQPEEEDNRRLNISSEENNLLESMIEVLHLDEKIANPSSSIYNSITESDDKGDKNGHSISNPIPQENEKTKYKVEDIKANTSNIEKSKKKKSKKNLNEAKEPVKSDNMEIENERNIENQSQRYDENQNRKNAFNHNQGICAEQNHGNDENQNMEIDFGQSHGYVVEQGIDEMQIQGTDPQQNQVVFNDIKSGIDLDQSLGNQDEEITDFTTISEINTNHEGLVDYEVNDEINQLNNIPNIPIDSEELNSSFIDRLNKIEWNH